MKLHSTPVPALEFSATAAAAKGNELMFWRRTARMVECRWRERTRSLRTLETEPTHPADERDAELGESVDACLPRDPKAVPAKRTRPGGKKRAAPKGGAGGRMVV